MARQITKELADKLVKKLRAKKSNSRGAAHDLYDYEVDGVLIVQISVRRGSEKDKGHDHLPKDLRLGPSQAKRLAQCPMSEAEYQDVLREKGLLPQLEDETKAEEAADVDSATDAPADPPTNPPADPPSE